MIIMINMIIIHLYLGLLISRNDIFNILSQDNHLGLKNIENRQFKIKFRWMNIMKDYIGLFNSRNCIFYFLIQDEVRGSRDYTQPLALD